MREALVIPACFADDFSQRVHTCFGLAGALALALVLILVPVPRLSHSEAWAEDHNSKHAAHEQPSHGAPEGGGEEAAPEAFVVLDLFSEALEASVAGIGVKLAELKPKVEDINDLYHHGEHHKAFAKVLGISTEIVILGFFIETFGIGDLFMSAMSLSGNWLLALAQSAVGITISSKAATMAGEKVEEATMEKYEEAVHVENRARKHAPGTNSTSHH